MEKINFINNQAPALNATNLNQLQTNIENGITESNIFRNLWNNGDISANRDNYYTLNNPLESGNYIFSWGTLTKTSEENPLFIFYDSANNTVGQINLSGTYQELTLTGTATKYRFYPAQYYDSSAGQTATLDNIQIEKGTKQSIYTKYAGYIVESGSNDNGSWIKYSDGTMICTKKVSGTIDMTTAWYTLYSGEFNLGSSPQTFISAPFVNYSMVGEYAFVSGTTKKPTTTSLGNVMLVRPSSLTNMPYEIDIIAIGKWK